MAGVISPVITAAGMAVQGANILTDLILLAIIFAVLIALLVIVVCKSLV